MLEDSLSYPTNGEGWLKKIFIGGVLSLFGALIVPGIFVQGYFVRVLRSAALGEETPPAFDEWGDMLVDGLKTILISVGYLAVPYLVLIAVTFVFGGTDGGSVVGLVVGVGAFVFLLVAAYVLPAALTNFALRDSVRAAFEFRTVIDAAVSGRYFVAVLLAVLVGTFLGIVGSVLMILLFTGVFVLFYAQVVTFYLFARGCAPKLTTDSSTTGSQMIE